ncbi:NAD(P)H-dependent oxidoreductase [Elioraea rosea]|uniref:NAD(P)H-dependent oxidoreductase n=1 Tax=Elioraea rosea TaxID=2492390 RepID=UPI001182A7A5|nr:NAD(P)H-dependent oxidoreductase [Elioraea rosea]
MAKRIVIIQGHPDPAGGHLCHALAEAYAAGAREAGHGVDVVTVASLALPPLQTKAEFERPAPPEVAAVQEMLAAADHLLLVFPLWLGGMPAVLKGALEQILRPSFALLDPDSGWRGRRRLAGISARVVVTMGMPSLAYRWWFGAHGVRTLDRAVLGLVGIRPVRKTYLGGVEAAPEAKRARWLAEMRALGRDAK